MKNLFYLIVVLTVISCIAMEENSPEPLKQIVIDYIRKNLAIVEQKSKIKKLPTTLKQELFGDELETADLAKIIDLVKCSLVSIDDLIYNVIFSHMQLTTYQKLTLLDLMMTRDDARDKPTNGYLFSCIKQYIKGFDLDWCSH